MDDEETLRRFLSEMFAESGYRLQAASDGFSGLREIRQEIPDVIISDLEMPGMSGFEFLSVVRHRFPVIQAVAMSGAFSGDGVPPGVAADAFYEKGAHPDVLFRIVKAMTESPQLSSPDPPSLLAPIWIPRNGLDQNGESYVIVTCTECLRAFAQSLGESPGSLRETKCVYCLSPIQYAIVEPLNPAGSHVFQRKPGAGTPTPLGVPNISL
ncbi:MAG TPA: response regulator [Acidobacteriaceae bacterium]